MIAAHRSARGGPDCTRTPPAGNLGLGPWLRALTLLGAGLLAACAAAPAGPASVRVLTYNIHHGEGTDGRLDLERLAGVIRASGADLVALQEVDRGTGRSGGVDQSAELGRLTGMRAIFGAAMPYDGGEYGEAVLSRLEVESSRVHALPHSEEHEPRCALEVRVRLANGAPLRFVGTHLDHTSDPSDRIAQAAAIERALSSEPGLATVLLGDFNDQPGARSLDVFADRWMDAMGPDRRATFPEHAPERAIDHIFVAPVGVWRKLSARVLDVRTASDHLPVWAELELVD